MNYTICRECHKQKRATTSEYCDECYWGMPDPRKQETEDFGKAIDEMQAYRDAHPDGDDEVTEKRGGPTIEQCLTTIRELNKDIPQSEELLKQKANWLYLLNRLSFWDDFPVLMDIVNYERLKGSGNDR